MNQDFSSVTEIAGHKVSKGQLKRVAQRYFWAGEFCRGKDVLEVACGAGQGLGYLLSLSKSLEAGDITPSLVKHASLYYGNRITISEMDAEELPFDPESLDVVILFEALYYLPAAEKFINECRRVLRLGGLILLATANRDLFDFNPSPFSTRYYNPPELQQLLIGYGFGTRFYGGEAVDLDNLQGKVIRWIKNIAVTLKLIPGSMKGKQWLKRLVFGKLVPMPQEIEEGSLDYQAPIPIEGHCPDLIHQVLYCKATKKVKI